MINVFFIDISSLVSAKQLEDLDIDRNDLVYLFADEKDRYVDSYLFKDLKNYNLCYYPKEGLDYALCLYVTKDIIARPNDGVEYHIVTNSKNIEAMLDMVKHRQEGNFKLSFWRSKSSQ